MPLRISHRNFIEDAINNGLEYVASMLMLVNHVVSGQNVEKILKVQITIFLWKPSNAHGFLRVPKQLKNRHGLLNIKTKRTNCFLTAITAGLLAKSITNVNGKTLKECRGNEQKSLRDYLNASINGKN